MSNLNRHDAEKVLAELDALLAPPSAPKTAAAATPPSVSASPRPAITLTPPPPEEPVHAAPIAAPAAPAQPRRARKILVIDDNKDYREIVKYLLAENGFQVSTAPDGHEGLRMAAAVLPDLILVDFNMPGLNGYEVIQELKSGFETRAIPIVMFTGAPNRRHLKSLGMQVADFLDKPVPNARLLGAVRSALGMADESAPAPAPADDAPRLELNAPGVRSRSEEPPAAPAPEAAPEPTPGPAPASPATAEEGEDLGADGELLVDLETDAKKEEDHSLEGITNDSPLVNRVNKILVRAVEMGASDIHIEPQEHEILVRVRVNGSLQKLCALPESLKARLAARIKIMANLVITERRRPQDGQFRAHIRGSRVEFRVSCLPSVQGEKLVLRVLGGGKVKSSLEGLGFSERDLDCVGQALQSPHGLILVTGPTGSGKTTTLYTMIRSVSKPDVNVCTAEDPVEYEMPGITQVHVKPAIGLTFENVLRSFLRQDPDVMLVGEIRDLETAEIAVKASITGHLVFSTLHTNSAPATVTRLVHMGLAPFLLAASVKLVVAQRLIKTLCPHCKLQVPLSDAERKFLHEAEAERLAHVFRGVGCRSCQQTGYIGRKPLFEIMPIRSAAMRDAIVAGGGPDGIQKLAVAEGMRTLRDAAVDCVAAGEASLGEAFKLILAD